MFKRIKSQWKSEVVVLTSQVKAKVHLVYITMVLILQILAVRRNKGLGNLRDEDERLKDV